MDARKRFRASLASIAQREWSKARGITAVPAMAPEEQPSMPSPTPRRRSRSRAAEPISPFVDELIRLTKRADPAYVQRWVLNQQNEAIDAELEELAVWVTGEWDPDVDTDRIRNMQVAGQYRMATNAIIAAMRRELAAEIRAHKRAKADALLTAEG